MTHASVESPLSTRDVILDSAQDFIQSFGYVGFSYRDVAAAIGIRAPTIHYYFPTKADLGRAVAERYGARFRAVRDEACAAASPTKALEIYAQLFRESLANRDRVCLFGMLMAGGKGAPDGVQEAAIAFFDENIDWLAARFDEARAAREADLGPVPPRHAAKMFFAGLEGAMVVANASRRLADFDDAAGALLGMWKRAPLSS